MNPPPPSSAYYDPHSKCIKLEGDIHHNGEGKLSGVIVDMSPSDIPYLQPGRMLMGKVIEIIDPSSEENKENLEDDDDDDGGDGDEYGEGAPEGSAGGILTHSFVGEMQRAATSPINTTSDDNDHNEAMQERTKEHLLQKQRQLQTVHAHQIQNLLVKQQKDWLWFHSKNLNEGRLLELINIHQKETVRMQIRQQREQNELLDLIFDIMMIERPRGRGGHQNGEEDFRQMDRDREDNQPAFILEASSSSRLPPGSGYETSRYEASPYEASSAIPLSATTRASPTMNFEPTRNTYETSRPEASRYEASTSIPLSATSRASPPMNYGLEASSKLPSSGYEATRYEASPNLPMNFEPTRNDYEATRPEASRYGASSSIPLAATSRASPTMNFEATRNNRPMIPDLEASRYEASSAIPLSATTRDSSPMDYEPSQNNRYEASSAPRRTSPTPPFPNASQASPVPMNSENSTPNRSPHTRDFTRSPAVNNEGQTRSRSPVPIRSRSPAPYGNRSRSPVPEANKEAPKDSSLPDRISTDRQKADEIKAVMRNRGLSRGERKEALAEIKERYANINNSNHTDSGDVVRPSTAPAATPKTATTATTGNEKTIAEQRRIELQSIMKDRTLGREEKQTKIAEIKSKYAAKSGREDSRKTTQTKIEAMKAKVAANKKREEELIRKMEEQLELKEKEKQKEREKEKEKQKEKEKERERERRHSLEPRMSVLSGYQMDDASDDGDSASGEGSATEEDSLGELDGARMEFARPDRFTLSSIPSESLMKVPSAFDDRSKEEDDDDEESASPESSFRTGPVSDEGQDTEEGTELGTDEGTDLGTDEGETSEEEDEPEVVVVVAPTPAKKKPTENEKSKSRARAASRWNKGAVAAVTAKAVKNSTVKPTAEESGNDTSDRDATDEEPPPKAKNRANNGVDKSNSRSRAPNSRRKKKGAALDDSARSSGRSVRSSMVSDADDMVFDGPNRSGVGLGKAPSRDGKENGGTANKNKGRGSISQQPASNNTSLSELPVDPLEDIPTDRTPIKKLIKKLNGQDAELRVLKLDGRKKIKEEDWESLFESLEENSTLTHLSMSRCEISDEMAVSLVLALVENETLEALRLNNNKGLTDDTAKGFVKVLLQSNKTLKKLELVRTKVTKKSTQKLNEILAERDDAKTCSKLQAERQAKIKSLLSFSAGDKIAKDHDTDNDDNGLDTSNIHDDPMDMDMSMRSTISGASSHRNNSKASSRRKMTRRGSGTQNGNTRTRARSRSTTRSQASTATGRTNRRNNGGGAGGGGRGARNPSMRASNMGLRASITAQQMAQLGGNLAVGGDITKLKEQRKVRGECEVCGQRCFTKTMFKTTPITVANLVYEGRCLKCDPM